VRPLYYDFPLEENAYKYLTRDGKYSQYMFGDDFTVAPIVKELNTAFNYM